MVQPQVDTGFIINLSFLAPWGLERMLQSLLHLVKKGLKFSEVALVAAHCLTGFTMIFFFYLGFLSRTFMNHRAGGEWGGHFLNSSLPPPSPSQIFRH